MVSLTETSLTGKPDAGNPLVRFGGRGSGNAALPTPIPKSTASLAKPAAPRLKRYPRLNSTARLLAETRTIAAKLAAG